LKDNDVRLNSCVPDNVLTPLIKGVTADNYFLSVDATPEQEAIGTVTGAYMAGLRGVVMMQTSGFALLANSLASLVMPYQIPAIMVMSERGIMGELNSGQALVARNMRPTLDAIGIVHHTLADEATMRHHRRPFRRTHHTAAIACLTAPISLICHLRLTLICHV
jgi:sulfopyruvate decarboxylase TPP-binding subunit